MEDFIIHFLLCNILISVIIGMLLAVKRLLRKTLTSRMQYNLWFLLLGLLAVPFLPAGQLEHLPFFSWLRQAPVLSGRASMEKHTGPLQTGPADWRNDFAITLNQKAPWNLGFLLCILWIAGIFAMTLFLLRSAIRFHALKQSALPLQNPALSRLYRRCLEEMNITRNIPIYSTAFLKSPVIAGLFCPCIYLPISLISDYKEKDLRYMLLHELSHYRHKDALANILINLAGICYWFNPMVWLAVKEMRNDREMACDASVLKMLEQEDYIAYGTTLINFAEKISRAPFPFASGISGSMAQMQKRVLQIAAYQKASFRKTIGGLFFCGLLTALCFCFIPLLSLQAENQNRYAFSEQRKHITYLDLTDSFGGYDGSFVLYDTAEDTWQIYNKEKAQTRVAPVSTYKIYSALLGLETGVISPEDSRMAWDGHPYEFDAWNADQTLNSAMACSATWYFQAIDRQAGLPAVRNFIREISYGNQKVSGDLSAYWAGSSLMISPIEQVELLQKFHQNQFGFAPENVDAVKESIRLSAAKEGELYGKTGTGEVNGQNALGWFIGYLETEDNTYFFAANIQNDSSASGSAAAGLTFSILSELGIWNE